jgi:type II secretory ATPase GspE/PulE/Tfp pilus assembly ATPase PilB-like protein
MEKLQIEIRNSTLPAEWGESIVMRIFNPKSLISLEELGLREDL